MLHCRKCMILFASRIVIQPTYIYYPSFKFTSYLRVGNSIIKHYATSIEITSRNKGSNLTPSAELIVPNELNDALAECKEDVSDYNSYHVPSFNLAAYVNKSHTLQELVKLGVDLYRIEGIKGASEAILKLDFERDVKKYLLFLNDVGIPSDEFGNILTKCPTLLFQDIDNLHIRLNYLDSKKFSSADVVRIFIKNPFWFTWRTQDIDMRLGFFQKDFKLTGDEVRHVSVRMPKLITYKLSNIRLSIFSVREEMGFTTEESKQLLLNKPKIYSISQKSLVSRFDYLHNVMKIPHSLIAQQPDGLLQRRSRLEARHGFLNSLSHDQYDPCKPNYVSMKTLLSGTDSHFATIIAKASVQTYNQFLKSL